MKKTIIAIATAGIVAILSAAATAGQPSWKVVQRTPNSITITISYDVPMPQQPLQTINYDPVQFCRHSCFSAGIFDPLFNAVWGGPPYPELPVFYLPHFMMPCRPAVRKVNSVQYQSRRPPVRITPFNRHNLQ